VLRLIADGNSNKDIAAQLAGTEESAKRAPASASNPALAAGHRAAAAHQFGGPRIDQLNTNTTVTGAPPCPGVSDCFEPLPDVDSRWIKLGADVRYFFARSVGVGLGLLYEDQNRGDFATIDANGSVGFTTPTDTPRVDYLGGLLTGYGARPYRGVTTFVRVLYRF
jgi:hypothetical protein